MFVRHLAIIVGLLLAAATGTAAPSPPHLATAHGSVDVVEQGRLIILVLQAHRPDSRHDESLTLTVDRAARISRVTIVERDGKSVVTQTAIELSDLRPHDFVTVIYLKDPGGPLLLSAVVQSRENERTTGAAPKPASGSAPISARGAIAIPAGIPQKVGDVLKFIDENGHAPEDYEGGRAFLNLGKDGEESLPRRDRNGTAIKYREWDVNPKIRGKNRGAERLITGSNGSAFFTSDHYRTFTRIR